MSLFASALARAPPRARPLAARALSSQSPLRPPPLRGSLDIAWLGRPPKAARSSRLAHLRDDLPGCVTERQLADLIASERVATARDRRAAVVAAHSLPHTPRAPPRRYEFSTESEAIVDASFDEGRRVPERAISDAPSRLA